MVNLKKNSDIDITNPFKDLKAKIVETEARILFLEQDIIYHKRYESGQKMIDYIQAMLTTQRYNLDSFVWELQDKETKFNNLQIALRENSEIAFDLQRDLKSMEKDPDVKATRNRLREKISELHQDHLRLYNKRQALIGGVQIV